MKLLYLHTGRIEDRKANLIQTFQMAHSMGKLGNEVTLALASEAPSASKSEQVIAEYFPEGPPAFSLSLYRVGSFFGKGKGLAAIRPALTFSRSHHSDVVFTRNPVLAPLVSSGGKDVLFESHHKDSLDALPVLDRWWRNRIVREVRRGRIKVLIPISGALADYWIDAGVPEERICTLHDAVDPGFVSMGLTREEARSDLNLPQDRKCVVYTGSLYKDRGIDTVFQLAKKRPEAHFIVVGGPDALAQRLAAEAKASELGNVQFTGRVPHRSIPLYLRAADVLLMLWSWQVKTISYCSPLKLFEYMAAERLIVGHGFPTICEVVTDGREALLADPDSPDELQDKLAQALDHPDSDMARRARKLVLEKYTWIKRCQSLLQHYAEGAAES